MKQRIIQGTRILLGLIFIIFGSNGLYAIITGKGFLPMPAPSPELAQVMGGFFSATYLMPLVKSIQVIAGVLLVFNLYVPLALLLLTPIVVNILGVHLFIDFSGLLMAIIICALLIFQINTRWDNFKKIVEA